MSQRLKRLWMLSACCIAASAALAFGADRPAPEIIKDIDAVKMPAVERSKTGDPKYIQAYFKQREEAVEKRNKLILELYKADPNNGRIPELMSLRWGSTPPSGSQHESLIKELNDVLAHSKSDKLKLEARFFKARAAIISVQGSDGGKFDPAALDEFIKLAPKDPRSSQLIYMATMMVKDPKVKAQLEERILKEYPDSFFAPMVKGARRQRDGIGKPFDLEFTDAVTGSSVSVGALKGKVVVVDFWATWCGPCVAEMPKMKKLYAKYHGQGVEFLGVSLDQPKDKGGLDALKKYVKENEIPWPQYYQGKGWQSEFSSSWGINSIPSMFLIDQAGKLMSVEARGKLEELIPSLLASKTEATPAGGQ